MEMHAGMSTHIVLFARIGKEIRLGASLHTSIEERQAVLWHHRRIVVACDDLQFAFQILGLSDEAVACGAEALSYGEIKAWFLRTYPEFAAFQARREAALAA